MNALAEATVPKSKKAAAQRRKPGVLAKPPRKAVGAASRDAGHRRRVAEAEAGADEVLHFAERLRLATPLERMAIEREGVEGRLLKALAQRMGIGASQLFRVLGVPRATAEKKAASNARITGAGGYAALGMIHLLGIAQGIVARSTATEAQGFDTARWLGEWIERTQPALGGRKPSEFLDTPTGIETIAQLLGAIESGVYL